MDEIEFASEGSVTFLCTDEDASVYMKILLNNEWVENIPFKFCFLFQIYD